MDPIAIKPAPGRRLVLAEGGTTLDGLGIAPGSDMPDEGAFVVPDVWARKRLDEGDAVPVAQAAIDAGQAAARSRDKPARAPKNGDTP